MCTHTFHHRRHAETGACQRFPVWDGLGKFLGGQVGNRLGFTPPLGYSGVNACFFFLLQVERVARKIRAAVQKTIIHSVRNGEI